MFVAHKCPKLVIIINNKVHLQLAPKCVGLKFQNSQYFSSGVSADDNHRKSLQFIFSGTNGNIKEASHTLLAYYLVIDKVQFCLDIRNNAKARNSLQ